MFFLFGGLKQLPRVEELEYAHEESEMVEICRHHNRVMFEKIWRYDEETAEIFQDIWDRPAALANYDWGDTLQDRTLVATHLERKRVNHLKWRRQRQEKHANNIPSKHATYKVVEMNEARIILRKWDIATDSWRWDYEKKDREGLKLNQQMLARERLKSDIASWFRVAKKQEVLGSENEEEPQEYLQITRKQILKRFYPAFAITVHVAQGSTFIGPYSILNAHKFRDRRMLYTALSRCKGSWKNIHIPVWQTPEIDEQKLTERLLRDVGRIYDGPHEATWKQFIEEN
ncbi:uncharacterized protein EV422DRAFT_605035 [Fimicolochytrium jonesii]|uniref:uncharacterized protein n=1 Tax=Fimicolochytrium jonesii TaxID=1396493 RepID=UPI0022FECB34|nr:uncharacterized protein EV422DRAFT_605035 [Fimicolochytrium jonesii]KAI8817328.1 hypothetical protein EV422DRAFT_605035 [Fimicolochytrium jonesii]